MKKPKYITVDNYKQFLPSEFVRSFVSDIEVAEKIGKPMDMSYYSPADTGPRCLPCLGGMACMNFGLPAISRDPRFTNNITKYTARVGDGIRTGNTSKVTENLNELYPSYGFEEVKFPQQAIVFTGLEKGKCLEKLKKQVHQYADALEAAGY